MLYSYFYCKKDNIMENKEIKLTDEQMNAVVSGTGDPVQPSNNACPRCGSTDVTGFGRDTFTGYEQYGCSSCGYTWQSMD